MHVNDKHEGPEADAADDYDLLPYPSMPYAYTQPSRLAAAAALHGLNPPQPGRARVLELGCAAGGNLIPLAARYPEAKFLGVDLARRHVDDACRRIRDLGLRNIDVQQADLTHLSPGASSFDYIICHGVFSWAPRAAQDAIFRICREAMADNGVAMVSYNVLPGWHLRAAVRDICLRYAGEGSPKERVAKVRAALTDIAAGAKTSEPYGLLLRTEAQRIAHRPASYILGEFLIADNSPCHFQEFVERARQAGLTYVCEADLAASVPESLDPQFKARISSRAGADPVASEQCIDDFTGRTFRCSVLTKSAHVARSPDFARIRQAHIAGNLRPDPVGTDVALASFKDPRGRAVRSKDPVVARALARLADAYPMTLAFAQLVAPQTDEDSAARLCKALWMLVQVGQADAFAEPFHTGQAKQERPKVWDLARLEAAAGQVWITSQAHTAVPLKAAVAVLIPHLDGTNDRARLTDLFSAAILRREVRPPELADDAAMTAEGVRTLAADYVERILASLAASALLSPHT